MRTATGKPFWVRHEVYSFGATVVAPTATVALVTCNPLAYHPTFLDDPTEARVDWQFIGSVTDAGAGSQALVRMVSDPAGAANIRGSSIILPVGAGLSLIFAWAYDGAAVDTPAFDQGQTLQIQGLNPAGAGNVSFEGRLFLNTFNQQAP